MNVVFIGVDTESRAGAGSWRLGVCVHALVNVVRGWGLI